MGLWIWDLGWLFFLLWLFFHFWQKKRILVQAQSWFIAKGHITECEWTKVGHSVWPKIEYSYKVEDKEEQGEHLFLDTTHNNPNSAYARQVAYRVAVAFKEETEVDVYYNPQDPEQSALDVSMPTKLTLILILISLLIGVHLGLIVWHHWVYFLIYFNLSKSPDWAFVRSGLL
jgi:hypothetical protein